jgi:hypothetical protein
VAPVEDRLREEFARPDLPPSLTADGMLARVAQARRRRTATRVAAAAVGLAAAAGAAFAIRPASGVTPAVLAPTYHGELVRARFTDHAHGYVLQRACAADPGAPLPGACRSELLATADAGRSWQRRALPGEPWLDPMHGSAAFQRSPSLHPAGGGAIAVDGAGGRSWTSADGGVTWQQAPAPWSPGPAGSADAIGPDERTVHLAGLPSYGLSGRAVAATDGSYWAACAGAADTDQPGAAGTGQAGVAVSRDQGRTWTTRATPGSQTWWVSTVDGSTVYAAVRETTGSVLVRSVDAGLTWTQVTPIDQAPDQTWAGLALPNGDVLVETATGTLRLRAGATSLERVGDRLAHNGSPYRTADWVVAPPAWVENPTPAVGSLASLSPDGGTTWIAVPGPS